MNRKTVPFTKSQIEKIIKRYPTPFHIYDEKGIREHARKFKKAFSILPGFKEYFAVKALPNPYILQILKSVGFGTDCSSLPELVLSQAVGITGENIMFTSNDTPAREFKKAKDLRAIINLDDITHFEFLEKNAGLPELICFRYNPGPARVIHSVIGNPVEAKYGLTKKQLFEGYKMARDKGIKRFGLHTMVASNELEPQTFIDTAEMLFELVAEISKKLNIKFEFVNLGGGIGVAYKSEQTPVDYDMVARGVKRMYDKYIVQNKLDPIKIYMENGRVITGPFGYLVTTAIHEKHTYKDYIGVDASMANLMRPGMYGAYHHITIMGKENKPKNQIYDVVGSICENCDKFAINRKLPKTQVGDIVVIHDTGAHGYSMGFNYNAKLRSAELLLGSDGKVKLIRRAETIDDYFRTLYFKGL